MMNGRHWVRDVRSHLPVLSHVAGLSKSPNKMHNSHNRFKLSRRAVRLMVRGMKFRPFLLPAAMLSLASISAQGTVLLNDTFADGSRTNQNLPTSAAFYYGATPSTAGLSVVDSALQFSYNTNTGILSQAVAYFTDSGSPITLSVGDVLATSISFSAANISNSPDALRIGFFNSGGSRVSADYTGISSPSFNAYTGYAFSTNLNSAGSNSGKIVQRTGTNNGLYTSAAFTNLKSSLKPVGYAANTVYTLTFEVEALSGSQMEITFSDSLGNVYSVIDTTAVFNAFDTLGIYLTNGTFATNSYTIDNVVVAYSPVPEPSALALGALGSLFVMGATRRKMFSHR